MPARMLAIYQQVGAQYKLPWEILAGIGKEECDHGQLPDPSCTPQPGATGPGIASFAGASGPMQVGVGGAAGDEYDALRHFLPNPSLGPHDPTTAVELAALVLIKDKGAPTGQPIDAYRDYARAYNGSGPMAEAYAARVLADAHAYQGAGRISVAAGCSAAVGTAIVPGSKARILADGVAAAPANAPSAVQAMIAAGNRINHFPYSYGGAHGDPAQTDPRRLADRRTDLHPPVGDREHERSDPRDGRRGILTARTVCPHRQRRGPRRGGSRRAAPGGGPGPARRGDPQQSWRRSRHPRWSHRPLERPAPRTHPDRLPPPRPPLPRADRLRGRLDGPRTPTARRRQRPPRATPDRRDHRR
jgi:hypothetical protein